jgi:HEPN domain-containing protein
MTPHEIELNIKQKFKDAKLLHDNGGYSNAIYLCGYCVELALKHAITNKLNWSEFREAKEYTSIKVHNLNVLLAFTGDEIRIKNLPEWNIVIKWDETKRYEDPLRATNTQSQSMLNATKKIVEEICTIL